MNGGEHRIWKKINNEMKIEKVIQPKPNLLLASIQNNMSFHDVNPIKEISGTRNALYIAISCNNPIWKKVKVNNFKMNENKLNYIYILTPKGIVQKTKLTIKFMKQKMKEYDELKKEIKKHNKEK